MAVRKILGVFRSAPIIPSEVEAALPPPAVRLNNAVRQYAFRIHKLPKKHPVKIAITELNKPDSDFEDSGSDTPPSPPATLKPRRQLDRISKSIQNTLTTPEEEVISNKFHPWHVKPPYVAVISDRHKADQADNHRENMRARMGQNLLVIYSDASSIKDGMGIGVGLAAYDYSRNAQETHTRTLNIGPNQLVYNGELEGITLAFEHAARVATPGQKIEVYADNQAAIHRLTTPSDKPGQHWQLRCIAAARKIREKQASISLVWVPGHNDIIGNERADSLAKRAAKMRPLSDTTSLAVIGMRLKSITTTEWSKVLADYKPAAIQRNGATYASKYDWKVRKRLGVPPGTRREVASAFYQLKIGHGYLKDHLYRITKSDSPLCSCGARQTPEHVLLSCKWLKDDRRILRDAMGGKHLTLRLLLHTKIGIEATMAFIERTKVCTRKWHLGQTMEEED